MGIGRERDSLKRFDRGGGGKNSEKRKEKKRNRKCLGHGSDGGKRDERAKTRAGWQTGDSRQQTIE